MIEPVDEWGFPAGGRAEYVFKGRTVTGEEFDRLVADEPQKQIEAKRLLDAKVRPLCPDCGIGLSACGEVWRCDNGHPAWPEVT